MTAGGTRVQLRDRGAPAPSADRSEEVLSCAEVFALDQARTDRQRQALQVSLVGLREETARSEIPPPYVHLPLLVYGCIQGEDGAAVPLAAATSLLFLGIDLIDDLADGDLPPRWEGHRPAEITLVAATLLCALPQRLLAGLHAPSEVRAALLETAATGLLRMSAGQHDDLAHAGAALPDPDLVEASVAAKSGEEVAMFATLAALLAGALDHLIEVYAEIGRCIGTGGQLASDCHDLFQAAWSHDLANGTRSLPIALHLARLEAAERAGFLALLDEAREDRAAQEAVRNRLRSAGELRRCAFIVETYCQRARRLLDGVSPREPAASGLRHLTDEISFFPKGGRP